jgi:hypothetical protein
VALRSGDYWDIHPYEAGPISSVWLESDERAVSVDMSKLTAHQRVATRAPLERVQAVIKGSPA